MPRSNSSLPPAVGIGGNSCRQCPFSMSVSGIGGSASSTVTLTGARRAGRSCRPTRGARRARQRRKAGVWSRPRVCENGQEPTSWRIVFSIALFPIAATALFLLRLAKSRRIFYAQTECLCFRTGWPHSGRTGHAMSSGAIAHSCPCPQARRSGVQILPSEASARRSKKRPRLVVLRLLRLWPLLLLTPYRRARAADYDKDVQRIDGEGCNGCCQARDQDPPAARPMVGNSTMSGATSSSTAPHTSPLTRRIR